MITVKTGKALRVPCVSKGLRETTEQLFTESLIL